MADLSELLGWSQNQRPYWPSYASASKLETIDSRKLKSNTVPNNDLIIRAAKGEDTERVPVWFMRQAGRSLPEYHQLRKPGSILDTIENPELSAEITIQPVRRYGVDAAILYSDIVVPAWAVGFGIEIVQGKGPIISQPFSNESDLKRLRPLEPETDTSFVLETIKLLVDELDVPLIGFAGAPFTVASYLIEGGPSKNYVKTKALMRSNPDLWHRLMEKLANLAIVSIRSQIEAGASLFQLFDSWVGILSPSQYNKMVAPHSKAIFDGLAELNVPSIHFGVGTGNLLPTMAGLGSTTIGVDDRTDLPDAFKMTQGKVSLQGNLDPINILLGANVAIQETRRVLVESKVSSGYIFNLGHGVLPESDPAILKAVVEVVHDEGFSIRHNDPVREDS